MLSLIAAESFEAPLLREAQGKLRASGAEATVEMARLERILGFLFARNNEVWRFFVGPLLLWDIHCVIALERWRIRVGKHVRPWLLAIGDVEALASLAGLAFEQPDYAFPDIAPAPCFDAEALGHPLIAAGKRVPNDVALKGAGSALVITGSNMSGKSTLLRAIGVNAVLALAGGPVCARRLALGPVRIAASMRVRDSLSEGVSRFYAEVRKLKAVIERARETRIPATLFLLDEVLHGTNSRERLIGARAIVRELVARGAMGGVSTHDLALGDMETELPGAVVNVHFEEQVSGDTMTFDYKLRPGVVHSSNALRIMRMVGIDVVDVG
jgi:DNA mismatch repair ATPase MutS